MSAQLSDSQPTTKTNPFVVGQYVDVQSRTWPGINKPGGIGRVSGVAGDRVSVQYLVGRRHEKEIPIQYVNPYLIPSERLRDRALLKGRCTNCGSLRNDCGSCDLSFEPVALLGNQCSTGSSKRNPQAPSKKRRLTNVISDLVVTGQPEQMDFHVDSASTSSSSDEDIEMQQRRYRRYIRVKQRAKQILDKYQRDSDYSQNLEESETEESDSDEDNIPLRQLVRQELLSQLSPMCMRRDRNDKSRKALHEARRSVLSDSSESTVDFASLSDASRSVSPPGTPDFSMDRTQEYEISALENTNNNDGSSSESHATDGTIGFGDEQALDLTLHDFIEPEGDATRMPQDTLDQTETLQFADLGTFFDNLAQSLEKNRIPEARDKVKRIAEQFETGRTPSQLNVLREECTELYNELMRDLVRDGTDQCQRALKRLEVKPDLQLEYRGFIWDRLQDDVEKILRELRALKSSCNDSQSEHDEVDSDDGWAEPTESPPKSSNQDIVDNLLATQDSTFSMDLHPYARKKRKARVSLKSRNNSARRETVKRLSRDHSKNKDNRPFTEIVTVRHHDKENKNDTVSFSPRTSKSLINKTKRKCKSSLTRDSRRQRSQTAVERMERFLLRNTSGDRSILSENENEDSFKSPWKSTKKRSLPQRHSRVTHELSSVSPECARQKQPTINGNQFDDSTRPSKVQSNSLSCYLLHGLRGRAIGGANYAMDEVSPVESPRSVVGLCEELKRKFPQSSCHSLFRELLSSVCASDRQVHSPNILDFSVGLIKDLGSLTLQELVSQENPQLNAYLALYVFILELVKRNLHHSLAAQHGTIFQLFHGSDFTFVNFLFLQFLETIYALAHPDAWALNVSDRRQIFEFLIPLRDALGEHFALTEHASFFIETRLENQKWRLIPSRSVLFVSSIDPDSWKLYLEKAITPKLAEQSRFISIGRTPCIPRVEVETLWRVFVFLSTASNTVKPEKGSRHRWKVISDIFSNGVFRTLQKTGLPSVRHLKAVEEDLTTFSSIISSGAMDFLPRKDSVVVEMIMKALLLHADALLHSEEFREAQLPTIDKSEMELKRDLSSLESLKDLCSSKVFTFAPATLTEHFENLLGETRSAEFPFSIGPTSFLLRASLMVQSGWLASAQRESNARMHLSEKAFMALIKYFRDESKKFFFDGNHRHSAGDAFQVAFPDKSILMVKGGLPDSRRSLFLQECAAYLFIVMKLSASAQQRVTSDESILVHIAKRSWETLGYDEMGDPERTPDTPLSTSLDIFRPYVMAKVLIFLFSWSAGTTFVNEFERIDERPPNPMDLTAVRYIVLGLTRCLEVSSHSQCSEIIYSIATMTEEVIAKMYHVIATEMIDRRCFASIIDTVLGGCMRASLNTIKFLSKSTFCGNEEDICFLSVLSLVRTALSFRNRTTEETESHEYKVEKTTGSNVSNDREMWGELDDDDLLCLMESVEGSSTESSSTTSVIHDLQKLRLALSESLRCSIPSLRYEISHSNDHSSHGKRLISRRLKAISMTLIFILVSEQSSNDSSLADLVNLQATGNMDDEEYRRKVLLYCCRSLCNFTSSPRALSVVRCSSPFMISVFIDALLTMEDLQDVPSCNFDRLPDDLHDARKRKAVDALLKFSRGNSLSRKTASIWAFRRELGVAFSNSYKDVFSLFTQIGTDFSDPKFDCDDQCVAELPNSLENEYLCRFRCLRRVVSTYLQYDIPGSRAFCGLCAEIIARSCEGLLQILKLLHVEEIASSGSPEPSYTKFKLIELFRCHSEFFVSILAWIFREGSQAKGSDFKEIWTTSCNELIAPIISSETAKVYNCFLKTYASFSDLIKKPRVNFPELSQLDANGECLRIVSSIFISFSKEILLPVLVFDGHSLQIFDKLLSAAARDSRSASRSICRIFFNDSLLTSTSATKRMESKLFQHICQHWDTLLTNSSLDPELEHVFVNLRHRAIETLVVISKRSRQESRHGSLFIINSILRRERKGATPQALKLEAVCSLIRAFPSLLKESLLEPNVDEEVIALIYMCLNNIFRRLAEINEGANFSKEIVSKCFPSDRDDPKAILSSDYVTTALNWFKIVSKILVGHDAECDNERMRLELREDGDGGWLAWEKMTCSSSLAHISREMKEIEKEIFPGLNPDRVVHNVYAAVKRTSTADAITEKWGPSRRLRQLIQAFNSK